MAGNVRFESSSASPEDLAISGNYSNGQRGNYSLDSSGNFREGSDSLMFSSASGMSRGMATSIGDVPPLSQCLMLDPITLDDQKYTRLGELRRVLGISCGTSAEDNSFGAAHSKPPPSVAIEELRRFKENLVETSIRARGRTRRLEESLNKLNKYCEALNSKKQQRNEMLTNERSGGPNLLKMGSLSLQNSPDMLPQKLEDRTKNVVLNKRVRSSVAETRAECRSNIPARQSPVMMKDRDMLKDGCGTSDLVEEKIRRLPAGGEGWDKKMKRKRSVGTVFTRPVDSDGELKRIVHHKLKNEPGLPSGDVQGFRSGHSNSVNAINKSYNSSLSAGSTIRAIPKSDMEKVSLSKDFMAGSSKERIKGNKKLNIREDNHVVSLAPLTKGKASRALRTSPIMATNSSPNIPRPSGGDNWEQPPSMNKANSMGGANNRKRPMSAESSSPPMAQWVGQRPQKISRSRRAILVSPVSKLNEGQISSEGCTSSDLGGRISSVGTNGLLIPRGVSNGTQLVKVKQEIVSSPVRLSESEESGAGENRDSRLKEKGTGGNEVEERATTAVQNVGSSLLLTKKSKVPNKEEIGDGVRRQGRSGRGSLYSGASVSPMREKLENSSSSKLLKSTRPGSDKNCSKSGRPPLNKLSDRKVFTRLGHTSTPDFSGESDDDREELLAAANFACNSSYLACSGSFWKKMELVFASLSIEDTSFLKQQLKSTDEHYESLSQGDLVHGQGFLSSTLVAGGKVRRLQEKSHSKEPTRTLDLGDEVMDNGDFSRTLDSEGKNEETPLYQRVLSALIVEGETEELEEYSGGRNMPFQYSRDNYPGATCLCVDSDSRKRDRIEFEYDSLVGHQDHKQFPVDRLYCNGSTTVNRGTNIQNQLYNHDFSNGGSGFMLSENRIFPVFSENGKNGPQALLSNTSGICSFDLQYQHLCLKDRLMLELQGVGLYIEAVPDLADEEDETVNQEIIELQKGLYEQIGKKEEHLNKMLKAIEEVREMEERGLEQVAMNRLVELAYKKKLATRGSNASKSGVTKVSKQVALAFMKRTLARCWKFEETGKSCFAEPAFRDVIFAAPLRRNDAESTKSFGFARNVQPETANSQPLPPVSGSFPGSGEQRDFHVVKIERFDAFGTHSHPTDHDFAKTGPTFNRGRKREVLLDDVGGSASLRAASALGNPLLGGVKGKRSERERDKDTSIRNAKSSHATMGNFNGERKMKLKPKQKTAQLSSSGNGFIDKFTETAHNVYSSAHVSKEVNNGSNKKRVVGLISQDNVHLNSSEEVKGPFDLIEELGGDNDLSNLLNSFNEDELQDQDLVGLQIPMDDLSELNMF